MQKLGLSQSLSQKLSPQQIQYIKLLQIPTAELDARIEEELETNPALEEGDEMPEKNESEESEDYTNDSQEEGDGESEPNSKDGDDEFGVDDYLADDDYSGYKMQGDFYEQEE